jgi:3-dehydroquinate dehydratase/shikimate dehydrogenase
MAHVTLIATVAAPLSSGLTEIHEIPKSVTCLQVRADLTGDVPATALRKHFPGTLLYSLRSSHSGGTFDGSARERQDRILSASLDFDLIELEADLDLSLALLEAIPPEKRLISWRQTDGAADLESVFKKMSGIPARFYCLCSTAAKTSDGLRCLNFLRALGRKDVAVICEGPSGCWAQLLAPHFGSPLVFGQLEIAGARGEFTIQQLIHDYGFPALHPLREIYGIAGAQILQSPSPRLHNSGYRTLRHPALFLPFQVESFEDFWREMIEAPAMESLGIPICGLTIVSPYKEAAIAMAEAHSPMVYKAGSSNMFVRRNNQWEAHTTDPDSVAAINGKYANGSGYRAAVIGCGGAGRAVAAALQQAGAEVTLVNRGRERGHRAVELLGLPFVPLSEFQAQAFSLLVNATPVGKNDDALPFAIDALDSGTTVVDLAYGKCPTPLVSGVLARGGSVIDGHDVLLTQVRKQFRMMIGRELPASIGRETVVSGTASEMPIPASEMDGHYAAASANGHSNGDRLLSRPKEQSGPQEAC